MSENEHNELNDWRINQMHLAIEQVKRDQGVLTSRLNDLKEVNIRQDAMSQKDLEAAKESRASQGKRIGALEAEMNDLRGMKKLLAVVGTLAVVALGALLKSILGGL